MNEFEKWCAAFCAWREARSEVAMFGQDSLRAIIHVIENRAARRGQSWAQVVFAYEQFSSITAPGDAQIRAGLVPIGPDSIFDDCYKIADAVFRGVDQDLTLGADYYFNPLLAKPSWAAGFTKLITIGHHNFYRGDK